MVTFTDLGLSAASKTELERGAKSQRSTTAAAVWASQLLSVAHTGRDTRADGTGFSAAMTLLRYLAQKYYCEAQFYTFQNRNISFQNAPSQKAYL